MFQNETLQLTEGPSSPLGPLKEREREREEKGRITHVSVTAAAIQIINIV